MVSFPQRYPTDTIFYSGETQQILSANKSLITDRVLAKHSIQTLHLS
jgi:hypothetical protein